jgi:hypothetical protein
MEEVLMTEYLVQFFYPKTDKWETVSKHELYSEAGIEFAHWKLQALIGGGDVQLRIVEKNGPVWKELERNG